MIVKTCRHNIVTTDCEWPDCRRIVQLESELATARANAFAECAKLCRDIANDNAAPDAPTPETDALWVKLMPACKTSGIAPATTKETFGLLDNFRALERDRNRLINLIGQMHQAVARQDWDEFTLLIEAAYEKP